MSINQIDNSKLRNKSYKKYDLKNCSFKIVKSAPILCSSADVFQYANQENNNKNIIQTNALKDELEKTRKQQGFIGKLWDGFKNVTKIGASSNKVQNVIGDYQKGLITFDEAQKALEKYKDGQNIVVDVVADIASGILSVASFVLAAPTGGASLPLGLGLATAIGAGVKIGIKVSDAQVCNKEYSKKNLLYDTITGAVNGLLAPVTNGIGNSVTKTIASKVIKETSEEVVEQGVKQGFKQFAKNIILNQSDNIVGGTLKQRALAIGAGMAVDGALGGAADNMVRAGLNNENVIKAGLQGALGGAIMAPVIGGGFRVASKTASKLGDKVFNNVSNEIVGNTAVRVSPELLGSQSNEKILENAHRCIKIAKFFNTSASRDYIDAIQKALDNGQLDKLDPDKLVQALHLLNSESVTSKELKKLSEQFHRSLVLNDCAKTYTCADEIVKALGINGELIKVSGKDAFTIQGEMGTVSARLKNTDSIFSKVRNKILQLKTDIPTKNNDIAPLVADVQGVRLVYNSADELDLSTIRSKIKTELSDVEFDDFIKYLKNESVPTRKQLVVFEQIEKELLNSINEEQTNLFVRNFSQGIKEGKIRITELHNYSSQNGIPYLSQKQLDTIIEAYSSWYKTEFELAKTGVGKYKIFTDDNGIKCLIDKYNNKFYRSILVETVNDGKSKVIKNNGYTAAQFNLVSRDGQLVEFQYRGSEINDLAESEHIIYDIKKNKDTVSGSEYSEVREILAKIKTNKKAMNEYEKYYNDVFKAYRKRELGICAKIPDIFEYPELSQICTQQELSKINADGIIELRNSIKAMKNK